MTLTYEYTADQVRVFAPGESSFPVETATTKERGNDDAEIERGDFTGVDDEAAGSRGAWLSASKLWATGGVRRDWSSR